MRKNANLCRRVVLLSSVIGSMFLVSLAEGATKKMAAPTRPAARSSARTLSGTILPDRRFDHPTRLPPALVAIAEAGAKLIQNKKGQSKVTKGPRLTLAHSRVDLKFVPLIRALDGNWKQSGLKKPRTTVVTLIDEKRNPRISVQVTASDGTNVDYGFAVKRKKPTLNQIVVDNGREMFNLLIDPAGKISNASYSGSSAERRTLGDLFAATVSVYTNP